MIPAPTSEKDDAVSKERYRTIAAGMSGGIGGDPYYGYRTDLYGHVSDQLKRHGTPVDNQRIYLVKGLFEKTLPSLGITDIAFAHVDCDWYDPVRFCLDAVAKKLSRNGLIVIDDYHDYKGCRRAVDEFLAANADYAVLPGVNPILRRRAA
jgi:asparagine synthase (glutamine-hydrolysing)